MPVFAALMLSPPAWVTVALLAGSVVAAVGLSARRIARARAAHATAAGDGVALGVDAGGRQVVLSDQQLSAHGLILGASGAGKSTTLLRILTDHVTRNRPVIAIDMKGSPSFAGELETAAAAAGRPFALWSIDGPTHWNPLSHGNPTELKDRLIATERFSEPHYKRAAERYAQMALGVLAQAHPGRPPTLTEIVTAMDPHRLPRMLRDLPRFAGRARPGLPHGAGARPGQRGQRAADAAGAAGRIGGGAVSGARTRLRRSDRPASRSVRGCGRRLQPQFGPVSGTGRTARHDGHPGPGVGNRRAAVRSTRGRALSSGARRSRRVLGAGCRSRDCTGGARPRSRASASYSPRRSSRTWIGPHAACAISLSATRR